MGQENTAPRKINGVEGAAGQVILSGGPGVLEIWGAPAPAIHGAAQHTDVTRTLRLPANEGFILAGTSGDHHTYAAVLGAANINEPKVNLFMKVPVDFVSFIKAEAIWTCDAVAGNMRWALETKWCTDGEVITTHAEAPATGETATGGANILNIQEPATPLSFANLAVDDFIGINFFRNGAHANDTLDDVVYLHALLFTYVSNQ